MVEMWAPPDYFVWSLSSPLTKQWNKHDVRDVKIFCTRKIWYFELRIFSFNSYVFFLTWCFIASTRVFNLLTCAFNLSSRAFNLTTRAFSLLTSGFELLTRGFDLVTRGLELVTRGLDLATDRFEPVTCGLELETRGFELVIITLLKQHYNLIVEITYKIRTSFKALASKKTAI